MGWPEALIAVVQITLYAIEFLTGAPVAPNELRGFGDELQMELAAPQAIDGQVATCFVVKAFPERARPALAGAFQVDPSAIAEGEVYCVRPAPEVTPSS